jgi:monofunctional glycosyltransferase
LKGRELYWLGGLFGGVLLGTALYLFWLPDVTEFKRKNPATTSFMLIKERQARAQGKKLPRVLVWRGLDEISENLRHAVLVAEDDGFYRHKGIDWESTRKALEEDWKQKRLAKGGSTITQQLARNLYLSPSKNPLRKVKEMLIARRLEEQLGKRRILELYLNVAEWGRGIYGAEAAARAYFDKSAAELTPEEGAALAAVLPSPRRYSPVKGTRFMESQKSRIIGRMRASGYLPEEITEETIEEGLDISSGTEVLVSPAPAGPY